MRKFGGAGSYCPQHLAGKVDLPTVDFPMSVADRMSLNGRRHPLLAARFAGERICRAFGLLPIQSCSERVSVRTIQGMSCASITGDPPTDLFV
jgi:hypothetical protein